MDENTMRPSQASCHRPFPAALGCLLLWLSACGPQQPPSHEAAITIIGGNPLASDSPARQSLVALVRKTDESLFCSGVLIAPDLVATARHCLTRTPAANLQVLFGDTLAEGTRIGAKETHLFPSSDRVFPNLDVAWIRLASPAPAPFKPMPIWHDAAGIAPDTPVLVAGFGRTATNCSRATPGCTDRALETHTSFDRYYNNARYSGIFTLGPTEGRGVCDGDSGGPSYVQQGGTWYALGLASGQDAILNGPAFDNQQDACEAGMSTQNALGDFAAWIATSSQTRLPFDASSNPRRPAPFLQDIRHRFHDILGWLNYDNKQDPAWYTVKVLVEWIVYDLSVPYEERLSLILDTPELARRLAANYDLIVDSGLLGSYDATIQDLHPLASLPHLQRLSLTDQSLDDLTPLTALTQLKSLSIDGNWRGQLDIPLPVDIRFVNQLPQLQDLSLRRLHGTGEGLGEGASFPNLISLDLNQSQGLIRSPLAWQRFPVLQKLNLAANQLTHVDHVASLSQLTELDLSHNQLTDIQALRALKHLAKLTLLGNPIKDFGPLADMPSLREVWADYPLGQTAPACPPGVSCHFTATRLSQAGTGGGSNLVALAPGFR